MTRERRGPSPEDMGIGHEATEFKLRDANAYAKDLVEALQGPAAENEQFYNVMHDGFEEEPKIVVEHQIVSNKKGEKEAGVFAAYPIFKRHKPDKRWPELNVIFQAKINLKNKGQEIALTMIERKLNERGENEEIPHDELHSIAKFEELKSMLAELLREARYYKKDKPANPSRIEILLQQLKEMGQAKEKKIRAQKRGGKPN